MDITALPFNRLVGVEPAAAGSGFLVSLPAGPQYANHLGTVHAVALLAVAEAGAGAFLARQAGVPAGLVPPQGGVEDRPPAVLVVGVHGGGVRGDQGAHGLHVPAPARLVDRCPRHGAHPSAILMALRRGRIPSSPAAARRVGLNPESDGAGGGQVQRMVRRTPL